MKIYQINTCRFYGDNTCVISSTTQNSRLAAMGIDANHQMKSSQMLCIKETGNRGWRRLSPDEASTLQRTIATVGFMEVGLVIGTLFFPPVGGLVGGLIGLKLGLKFGGVGREASVMVISQDEKTVYVGSLPLWQVKKIEDILETNPGGIHVSQTEVKYGTTD